MNHSLEIAVVLRSDEDFTWPMFVFVWFLG